MSEQEFIFGEELTLDRATAPGTSPMPTDIRGVVSEAAGVMRARGELASVVTSSLEGLQLLGYDESGLAGFARADPGAGITPITLTLLKDSTLTTSTLNLSGTDWSVDDFMFIPRVGLQAQQQNTRAYLVLDKDGVAHEGDAQTPPVVTVAGGTSGTAGDLDGSTWNVLIVRFIQTDIGKYSVDQAEVSDVDLSGANHSIEVSVAAHAFGDNYLVDVYLREDGTSNPYVLSETLGSGDSGSYQNLPVGLELEGLGDPDTGLLIEAVTGSTTLYRGRIWGKLEPEAGLLVAVASTLNLASQAAWRAHSNLAVAFSGTYLNVVAGINYVENISVPGSNNITGLAATETGLFVFGENGAGLIYGDPSLALTGRIENFGQRPVDQGLGHDNQQPPALLGGTAFHVWRGRVYVINGNASTEISGRIYNADDEFVAVIADNVNKLLLCLTENKNVFIYDAVQRMWLGDSASDGIGVGLEDAEIIVPNATHGVVYVHFDPDGTESTVFEAYGTASFEDMVFDFDDFSMGDRFRRDLWVALEVFIENPASTPTVSFDTESGDSVTLGAVDGRKRDEGDLYDFVFPWGIACRMGDWALTIPSDATTRAYLPWKFRFIDREDSRWGKDDEAP